VEPAGLRSRLNDNRGTGARCFSFAAQWVVTMTGNRYRQISGLLAAIAVAAAGCGSATSGPGSSVDPGQSERPLPPGVMSAVQACRQVIDGRWHRRFFTGVERVHLVLTTYAKGEPVESQGDISYGMPPQTLVWVVEVHAKTVSTGYLSPPGDASGPSSSRTSSAQTGSPTPALLTDYSVVMNARTARATDGGACNCWPLPLWKVGTVVSLPPQC